MKEKGKEKGDPEDLSPASDVLFHDIMEEESETANRPVDITIRPGAKPKVKKMPMAASKEGGTS